MKFRIVLCLILLLFLANVVMSEESEWLTKMKQINLLSHNRGDVIKLLGNPVDDKKESYLWYYDFDEGRMAVLYESGGCVITQESNGKPIGWKVPEWTVIEVSFSPDDWINPKKLNVNFKGFSSKPIYDEPNAVEYVNDNMGIEYTVNEGKIQDVTFRPAKSLDYLRCK